MKRVRNSVSLTGGLGNQLFQLAAALASTDEPIGVLTGLGKPRGTDQGNPDIFSFNLPKRIFHCEGKKSWWLSQKAAGYVLRLGVNPAPIEKFLCIRIFSRLACSIILSINYSKPINVIVGRGVGYHPMNYKRNQLLIGYFQSYKWAAQQKVLRELMEISPKESNPALSKLIRECEADKPLVVHVRLGDYLLESSFGIPEFAYYKKSIEMQMSTGKFNAIWLFSDEPEKAVKSIPEKWHSILRMIDHPEFSPAQTLEAMRLGHGYVIANSTFSWWGAFLSQTENAPVIAPHPWFSKMESPVDLIPIGWRTMPSGNESR